jgi:hypothetical protein
MTFKRLAFVAGLTLVVGCISAPTSHAQVLCKTAVTCADAGALCRAGNFSDCAAHEATCNGNGGVWRGKFVTCRVRGAAGPKPKRPG